jgi:hypothetical protein
MTNEIHVKKCFYVCIITKSCLEKFLHSFTFLYHQYVKQHLLVVDNKTNEFT